MTRVPIMTTSYEPLEVLENRHGDITKIEYHNATPHYLYDRSNDASERLLERSYAAVGLARLCLDKPAGLRDATHLKATVWAGSHVLTVRDTSNERDVSDMPEYFSLTKPNSVSGVIDDMTIIATAVNRPERFSEIIHDVVPDTENALVIALGHGGILAAADTHVAGVGEQFYPVRFSLRKRHDAQPVLSDHEKRYLTELSRERTVMLIDEDASHMMTTLCAATEFFAHMFDKTVFGAVPAHINRLGSFAPAIITSEKQMLIGPGYPGYWGGQVIG